MAEVLNDAAYIRFLGEEEALEYPSTNLFPSTDLFPTSRSDEDSKVERAGLTFASDWTSTVRKAD